MSDEPDHLRAVLGDVPAPDPAARERALAAAMGVFDAQHAPRRRSTRWLMPVAAGLVGVVAIGGAVALVLPASEDRLSSTAAVTDRRSDEAMDAVVAPGDAEAGAATATAPTLAAAPMVAEDATMVAAEAASTLPRVGSDAQIIEIARPVPVDASSPMACGRDIVATVLDERTPGTSRVVLLTRETTAAGTFVVVLAPEGEPDACAELDRVALP